MTKTPHKNMKTTPEMVDRIVTLAWQGYGIADIYKMTGIPKHRIKRYLSLHPSIGL